MTHERAIKLLKIIKKLCSNSEFKAALDYAILIIKADKNVNSNNDNEPLKGQITIDEWLGDNK